MKTAGDAVFFEERFGNMSNNYPADGGLKEAYSKPISDAYFQGTQAIKWDVNDRTPETIELNEKGQALLRQALIDDPVDASSAFRLGEFYKQGLGKDGIDLIKSAEFFIKAHERNHPQALSEVITVQSLISAAMTDILTKINKGSLSSDYVSRAIQLGQVANEFSAYLTQQLSGHQRLIAANCKVKSTGEGCPLNLAQ